MTGRDEAARPSLEAMPGTVLDRRYRVRREIARGGMGAVLEVEQIHTGRRLALKLAFGTEVEMPSLSARLMREARALELSRGPGVLDVVDAGIAEGEPYVVLEMLEGRGLDGLLTARRSLSPSDAVAVAHGACGALESVHRAGLVHRDVKPANLFVASRRREEPERVVLIDFGIARLPSAMSAPKLTASGEHPGTLEYMAPEQALEGLVDHRADLFALGLCLYECIAGEPPFPDHEMPRAVLDGSEPPALHAGAMPAIDAFLRRVLDRDPARRPASARAFSEELAAITGIGPGPLRILDAPVPPALEAKRVHARVPFVAPLRVVDDGGARWDGQTADVSEGGVLAMLAAPVALGSEVVLRFGLPISGRVAALPAVARWAREARHGHAIGFELRNVPPDALAELRRLVELSTPR